MSKRRSNSSEAMMKFLKKRVEANQGISLQNLTGHLSQLPFDLRMKYGSSVKSLKVFLQQFPKVFVIRNDRNVYVLTSIRESTSSAHGSVQSLITSTSDRGMDEEDGTCLTNVRGTVCRIFNVYGFISTNYPIKTSVFFDVRSFENAEHTSLASSGLQVGDSVILDAKLGPKDCKAIFRATRVTRESMNKLSSSPCLSLVSASDGDGGCDTSKHLVNQHGVIERVKPNYGFIKFGRNQRERAFFHANNVDKSLLKSNETLPDVFTNEDKVRFNAKRSKKPSDKVKWEATAVCLCQSRDRNFPADSEDELRNEIFMSDDESDIEGLPTAELDEYKARAADFSESPVGKVDGDAGSVKSDSCNSSVKGKRNARLVLSEWERRQKLSGERGFFYPVTESVGTVKFGPGRGSAACAAVEVTYHDKVKVENLLWEVCDGQEVSFDAVQAENNTWIATLVWTGQRPAKPLVGDSEGVFYMITNKSMGAQKPLPSGEPEPRDDSGADETPQNVWPGSQSTQPSITIYKDVKGVIVHITEYTGTCEVRELSASRKIKFTSELFYMEGKIFTGNLNEVLCEGDEVFLDYMVGVRGTKEEIRCDLVWQGRRPRELRQMSPEEFGRKLQMDTQDGEKSLYFEDFGVDIERTDEAARGPYRMPTDTGLPEDNVPGRGSGASSSVSGTGPLVNPPEATSTLTYIRSLGAQKESSTCESAPDLSFVSANVDDKVLRRLAKMVAANIIAEKRRLRVVLHDTGVQTLEEDAFSSPYSVRDGLLPSLLTSSTQTLSTGAITSEGLFIK